MSKLTIDNVVLTGSELETIYKILAKAKNIPVTPEKLNYEYSNIVKALTTLCPNMNEAKVNNAILNNDWSAVPDVALSLKKDYSLSDFYRITKKQFYLLDKELRKKNVNLTEDLISITNEMYKDNENNYMSYYVNQMLSQVVYMINKNLYVPTNKDNLTTLTETLSNMLGKSMHNLTLTMLYGCLYNEVDKTKCLEIFKNFIKRQEHRNDKANEILEKVIAFFTKEELESTLTPNELRNLENKGFNTFEVDSTIFILDLTKLKKNGVPANVLQDNVKNLANNIHLMFEDIDDFITYHSNKNINEYTLSFSYEKNGSGATKTLADGLVSHCVNMQKCFQWNIQDFVKHLTEYKSKFIMANKLENSLKKPDEDEDTPKRRNKI